MRAASLGASAAGLVLAVVAIARGDDRPLVWAAIAVLAIALGLRMLIRHQLRGARNGDDSSDA